MLGDLLVDLHGQQSSISVKEENHRGLIDSFETVQSLNMYRSFLN